MKLDWFTVIAQIINFLILVWLLKRFLYKPILNAIDEREKKIIDQLKDADDKKAAAAELQDDFNKKNADFDQQKMALMDKVVADVNEQRDKLLEAAKNDANTLRTGLEKAIKEKEQSRQLEIADKTQKQVFTITKKALADISSSSLEDQSVNTFIKRLSGLNDDERGKFTMAFKSGTNTIAVRSASALSVEQQSAITVAVNKALATQTGLQFKTAPELICGIELITDGYKLAWSFSEYLNALQNSTTATADDKSEPQAGNHNEPKKQTALQLNTEPVKNQHGL